MCATENGQGSAGTEPVRVDGVAVAVVDEPSASSVNSNSKPGADDSASDTGSSSVERSTGLQIRCIQMYSVNVVLFSGKLVAFVTNLGGLVLGCMEADVFK